MQPRVLLVDDDPRDRVVTRRLLGTDFEVLEAETGADGIALCRTARPACVLLDQRLPDHDAIHWLPEYNLLGVGVVVLTGFHETAQAIRCLTNGAHDYLLKEDLTGEALRRALRHAVDRARDAREIGLHRRIIEHMPIGVCVFEREESDDPLAFRALWQNESAARISGVPDEVMGTTLRESNPGLASTPLIDALQRAVDDREATRLEHFTYGDSNIRPSTYDIRAVPLGGRLVAMLFEDVAPRLAAEREKSRLEQRSRAAQRMEAIGRLAGGIAHDLNNLLCVVRAYGDRVHSQLRESDPLREDLAAVLQAADSGAGLTNQLLAFSRQQPPNVRVIDLNTTVAQVERMLHRLLGAAVRLELRMAPRLGPVRADPSQMEQVLVNLALNARDAMPDGGTLTIETGNVRLETEACANSGLPVDPGAFVRIAVRDTGRGMAPDVVEQVFEPFFTTKGEHGTGLGLATVHAIVERARGLVEVRSEIDRGTTFEVFLPVCAPSEAADAAPSPADDRDGTERVLVVEDDDMVRRVTQRILEGHGYEIETADTAEAGLALAQHADPPFDLVLTDVVLPGLSGPELAERMDALDPAPRVLLMSGYASDQAMRGRPPGPERAWLHKPFTPAGLLARVREVLDRA